MAETELRCGNRACKKLLATYNVFRGTMQSRQAPEKVSPEGQLSIRCPRCGSVVIFEVPIEVGEKDGELVTRATPLELTVVQH